MEQTNGQQTPETLAINTNAPSGLPLDVKAKLIPSGSPVTERIVAITTVIPKSGSNAGRSVFVVQTPTRSLWHNKTIAEDAATVTYQNGTMPGKEGDYQNILGFGSSKTLDAKFALLAKMNELGMTNAIAI